MGIRRDCLKPCGMYHLRLVWYFLDFVGNEHEIFIKDYASNDKEELEDIALEHANEYSGVIPGGVQLGVDRYEHEYDYCGYECIILYNNVHKKCTFLQDGDPNWPGEKDAILMATIEEFRYGNFQTWCKGVWK